MSHHRESPLLDDDAMLVLSTGYLLRPTNRDALRECLSVVPSNFDATVDALVAAGFLAFDAGTLRFESPYATFVSLGRERAARAAAESERTAAMMSALPDLIRAWDISEGHRPIAGHEIRAEPGTWTEWFRYVDAETPVRPSLVITDPDVLDATIGSGHLHQLQERVTSANGGHVRVLVPDLDGWPPESLALVEGAVAAGVRVRRSAGAITWMYVDAGGLVGLPLVWRSGTPTNAVVIRTAPVVAGIALLFDALWSRAAPYPQDNESWAPILELLSRGATDDAVARTLGLATRTVRRRIADAMEELGATSRFSLGAAWQARTGQAPVSPAVPTDPPRQHLGLSQGIAP